MRREPEGLRPRLDRAEVVIPPGGGNPPISLHAHIELARQGIDSARLRDLAARSGEIAAKMALPSAQQHADLHDFAAALGRLMEVLPACTDPLPHWLSEAGVAIEYLLEGGDLIPDSISEIGLTDDARLVALVFSRNPELRAWL